MFSHRPAVSEDFTTICRFPSNADELFYMAPSASFPLTPNALQAIAKDRESPTVVTWNNDVAAYAALYFNKFAQTYFIGNVIVAPAHRGKGAAAELIGIMADIARRRFDVQDIRLSCMNQNTAGLRLYTKLGFTPYAMEERQNSQGERMVKIDLKCDLGKITCA